MDGLWTPHPMKCNKKGYRRAAWSRSEVTILSSPTRVFIHAVTLCFNAGACTSCRWTNEAGNELILIRNQFVQEEIGEIENVHPRGSNCRHHKSFISQRLVLSKQFDRTRVIPWIAFYGTTPRVLNICHLLKVKAVIFFDAVDNGQLASCLALPVDCRDIKKKKKRYDFVVFDHVCKSTWNTGWLLIVRFAIWREINGIW